VALYTNGKNFMYEFSGLAFTNTLTRFNIALNEDLVDAGFFDDISIHLTAIAGGGSAFSILTIGWVNADNNYIAGKLSAQSWTTDSADATIGDFSLNLTKKFGPVPSDATGIWIGIKTDAGTATGKVRLLGRTL